MSDMTEAEAAAKIAEIIAQRDAEYDAKQAALRASTTPHVRKAPKRKPGRMSGPRYFNLMREMEAHPEQYADYRPTNYCGAPLTQFDWDKRSAVAQKNAQTVIDDGVCEKCLTEARNDTPRKS